MALDALILASSCMRTRPRLFSCHAPSLSEEIMNSCQLFPPLEVFRWDACLNVLNEHRCSDKLPRQPVP